MKPALKVVSTVSPQRQALAQAISEAAPAVAAVTKARTTAEAARGALADALGAVPAAERAVADAKARLIENPAADRSELRTLRQAEADARDDLEIAREVAARAELRLADAERSAHYAAEAVQRSADVVIVSNFAPALEAAELAGREFARLAFIAGIIGSFGDHWSGEQTRMVGRVETLNPHFVFRNDTEGLAATRQAAQAPWHVARAALLTDADAALPEIAS